MAGAGQGRGEMDLLAGYIYPPIDENGVVSFTVMGDVRVTTSLEGMTEVQRRRGAMAVLDDKTIDKFVLPRGVRFTGRPGQAVTIRLHRRPLAPPPGFRELGDDGVELKVSIPIEGSSSKTDEPSDFEERARKVGPPVPFEKKKEPVEEDLRKEFEQKLQLSLEGQKEDEPPVDPQSEVEKLKQSLREYEERDEQVKLCIKQLEGKESTFITGKLADKLVDKTPGIADKNKQAFERFHIITAQDLCDKYKEMSKEAFKDWIINDVGMKTKDYNSMNTGFVLREIYKLQMGN